MTTRIDTHRVSQINPTEYNYVLSYSLPSTLDGWQVPAVGLEQVRSLKASGAAFAEHGGVGTCTVCGTGHIYGDVWRHEPTAEHIFVGHICAEKYSLIADRMEWEHEMNIARRTSAREAEAAWKAERADEFIAAHDGLAADLAIDHYIIRDVASKLSHYGSISDKQIALVRKIADEHRNPKTAEKNVPAPIENGRQTVEGEIVSVKVHESAYGTSVKMTVKVTTDEGAWLAWGTLPNSLVEEQAHRDVALSTESQTNGTEFVGAELRGSTVRFDAKLKRGRDAYFALFSRPTKATIVSWAE